MSPSRARNHSRLRTWRSVPAWKRFRTTAIGTARALSASTASRTALIVPSPASATSRTKSGPRSAKVSAVPILGQRREEPAGGLDQPHVDRDRPGRPAQLRHEVVDGEGRAAQRRRRHGGAIATSYQRWGGQTSSAGSPVAAPSKAASRPARSSEGSKDCAGLRATTRRPPRGGPSGAGRQPMSSRHRSPCRPRRQLGAGAPLSVRRRAPGRSAAAAPARGATGRHPRRGAPPTRSPADGWCRPAPWAGGWPAPRGRLGGVPPMR